MEKEDGSPAQFTEFVKKYYISDPVQRERVFHKISNYFESISGNSVEITLDLRKVLDEAAGEIDEIDRMFGNYSVGSHLSDDLYNNKIAFVIGLNFPYFSLEEKEKLGPDGTGLNGLWHDSGIFLFPVYLLRSTSRYQKPVVILTCILQNIT